MNLWILNMKSGNKVSDIAKISSGRITINRYTI